MSYTSNWFPESLSAKEQDELCKKLPDKEAKDTLIFRNMRLVGYIARKYNNTEYPEEELISAGTFGLIKAVDTFNYSKGIKLATYATRCIENEILMHLRKEKKHKREVSFNTVIKGNDDGEELIIEDICEDKKSNEVIKKYEDYDEAIRVINYVSNKIYSESKRNLIIFMYMIGGKTQREVKDLVGVSQSYVSRLFKNFRKRSKQASQKRYKIKNDEGDFLHFYKDEECICLRIQGYLTIRTEFEVESFEKIAEFLRFLLM